MADISVWVVEEHVDGEWRPVQYHDEIDDDLYVVGTVKREDAEKYLSNLLVAWPGLERRIREYIAVEDIDW